MVSVQNNQTFTEKVQFISWWVYRIFPLSLRIFSLFHVSVQNIQVFTENIQFISWWVCRIIRLSLRRFSLSHSECAEYSDFHGEGSVYFTVSVQNLQTLTENIQFISESVQNIQTFTRNIQFISWWVYRIFRLLSLRIFSLFHNKCAEYSDFHWEYSVYFMVSVQNIQTFTRNIQFILWWVYRIFRLLSLRIFSLFQRVYRIFRLSLGIFSLFYGECTEYSDFFHWEYSVYFTISVQNIQTFTENIQFILWWVYRIFRLLSLRIFSLFHNKCAEYSDFHWEYSVYFTVSVQTLQTFCAESSDFHWEYSVYFTVSVQNL